MNFTVLGLIRACSFGQNSLFTAANTRATASYTLSGLRMQKFFAPIFSSANSRLNLNMKGSTFNGFLSRVASIESVENEYFTQRQVLSDEFLVKFHECGFMKIQSDKAGGAFYVKSESHSLNLNSCSFVGCTTTGWAKVGQRPKPVGAGAYIFEGARAEVVSCAFIRCFATSNTQVFHSFILHDGGNTVSDCLFWRNGKAMGGGKNLFALDNGAAELKASNISRNYVPMGYAGGVVGWFASASTISYTVFDHNIGKSIFGSCAYSPEVQGTKLRSVMFLNNVATKHGVYMRHTGFTNMEQVVFINNTGHAFYGTSPLQLHRCYFDCEKPTGQVDVDSCQFNLVEKKTIKVRVRKEVPKMKKESPVNITAEMEMHEHDVDRIFTMHGEEKLDRIRIMHLIREASGRHPHHHHHGLHHDDHDQHDEHNEDMKERIMRRDWLRERRRNLTNPRRFTHMNMTHDWVEKHIWRFMNRTKKYSGVTPSGTNETMTQVKKETNTTEAAVTTNSTAPVTPESKQETSTNPTETETKKDVVKEEKKEAEATTETKKEDAKEGDKKEAELAKTN